MANSKNKVSFFDKEFVNEARSSTKECKTYASSFYYSLWEEDYFENQYWDDYGYYCNYDYYYNSEGIKLCVTDDENRIRQDKIDMLLGLDDTPRFGDIMKNI
jgi:hypothetical protein